MLYTLKIRNIIYIIKQVMNNETITPNYESSTAHNYIFWMHASSIHVPVYFAILYKIKSIRSRVHTVHTCTSTLPGLKLRSLF
jgi:hypothetical protein